MEPQNLWTAADEDRVATLFKKLLSNPWHQFSDEESALLAWALAEKLDRDDAGAAVMVTA